MDALKQGNGLFFTLRGSERVSASEMRDVVILHGLVLPPAVPVRGSGVESNRNCLLDTEAFTWKLGDWKNGPFDLPDQRLEVHYNGKTHEAAVGSLRFDTRKGNLLIIKLDGAWKASTLQVPAQGNGEKTLADFRNEFPNIAELQNARLHNEDRP